MADYQTPEMLRTSLEELCLQIKLLRLGRVVPFLEQALQPPPPAAVENALASLRKLKALDELEELTPLGFVEAAGCVAYCGLLFWREGRIWLLCPFLRALAKCCCWVRCCSVWTPF
jgi:hypothetical protein